MALFLIDFFSIFFQIFDCLYQRFSDEKHFLRKVASFLFLEKARVEIDLLMKNSRAASKFFGFNVNAVTASI